MEQKEFPVFLLSYEIFELWMWMEGGKVFSGAGRFPLE